MARTPPRPTEPRPDRNLEEPTRRLPPDDDAAAARDRKDADDIDGMLEQERMNEMDNKEWGDEDTSGNMRP